MAIAKKRKKFFDVEIPIINRETQLQAMNISELEGREIKYDLTRILKGKSILMNFKVKVKEDKATSVPKEIKLMPYYLRRMVRKGTDYVEDSFLVECKDAQIHIKPFMITRRKVSRAVKKAIRENAKKELITYLKSKKAEEIFEEILRNRLQKSLSMKLKKIYPLSLCEIRSLKIIKEIEEKKEEKPEKDKKADSKKE